MEDDEAAEAMGVDNVEVGQSVRLRNSGGSSGGCSVAGAPRHARRRCPCHDGARPQAAAAAASASSTSATSSSSSAIEASARPG